MAQNIEADKNDVVAVSVAHAAAAVGDKVIARFNQLGVNIFIIATENLGGGAGDLVIDPGVGYEFDIPVHKSLLLADSVAGTWTIHKMRDTAADIADNLAPLLVDSGNLTVVVLDGGPSEDEAPIGFENLNRVRPDGDAPPIADDTDITQYDDTVIFTPAEAETITGTLLEPELVIGKRHTFYNNGDGAVNISDESGVLFVLNAKGDSITIQSTAIGWIKV